MGMHKFNHFDAVKTKVPFHNSPLLCIVLTTTILCRWTEMKPRHSINEQFCNSVLFYGHFVYFVNPVS